MADQAGYEKELKTLTEVCSLAMEHAAVALSQLMGKGVHIRVPRLQVLDAPGMTGLMESREVTALQLRILGNVRGSILILLLEENANRMLELLLGEVPKAGEPLSGMERATLMEVGNILASACLNALGNALKTTLLPSVPALSSGNAREILERAMEAGADGEKVVMIDTVFDVSDARCGGSIFLMPAPASLGAMLASIAQ